MAQILMGAMLGMGTAFAGLILAIFGAVAHTAGERGIAAGALLAMTAVALLYGRWLLSAVGA